MKHLQASKYDEKRFHKLLKLMISLHTKCETADQLLAKFADRCYGKLKDRTLAKIQARTFIDVMFGGADNIMKYGPEVAVRRMLEKQYSKSSYRRKTPIKVVMIEKRESLNFNAHLHKPNDADIEKHPMWTRRLKQYLVGPILGVGGTAKVRLAYDTKTRRKVALKIVKPKYIKTAEKEFEILKKLNHKNIVRVHDCFSNVQWKNQIMTVFAIEYANHGELIEYLMYTSKFEDDLARWFFCNLTEGIEYCHAEKIIHRDLKHDNCLLGENFVLKITDFGFATNLKDEMMKTPIGTEGYAAPEITKGKYTDAVDLFSMGVMLFIALAGSQPWKRACIRDRWYRMVHKGQWKKFFEYHKRFHTFTEEQKIIIRGLLEPNPESRWKLRDIKRCKWFNGKQISQDEVAMRLQVRKRVVDDEKFKAMRPGVKTRRRAVGFFSKRLPYVYFQPTPRLSFVTDKKPEWVLEEVANSIINMKGTITHQNKEKYKLTFYVTKLVDSGRYMKGETIEKEYEKVRVYASVQMWTHPGQKTAIEDREKILAALSGSNKSFTKELEGDVTMNFPKIKSIAVFRAEGGGLTRYLFPAIYSDILRSLPADFISTTEMDD